MNARTPIPLRPDRDALARSERRSLHRALAGLVLTKPSSSVGPEVYVARVWPDDTQAARIAKAASAPASTTNTSALQLSTVAVFRSLAPKSAALALFDYGLSVDLSGLQSVRIPAITTMPAATFVAEAAAIPALNLNFAASPVGPVKKLALISAVSEELEAAGPELASAVIGRVLSDAVAKGLDAIAFGSGAGDAITPAGLLNGIVPIVASTATPPINAMFEDIGNLTGAIADNNVDTSDLIFVAGPKQAMAMKLFAGGKFDFPILSSLALKGSLAAFAAPAIASAFGNLPAIENTRQALVNFETSPATDPLTAGPSYSVFQMGLIAIKVRADAAWTLLPGGGAVVNSVTW